MSIVTTIDLSEQGDLIAARRTGREMAKTLGFGLADQTRLATAISELARNVLQYAGTGVCVIADDSTRDIRRIVVVVEDQGPGILDVEQALQDGYSTSGGLGAGLPGVKRLVHEFIVESEPCHTKITIAISRKALQP